MVEKTKSWVKGKYFVIAEILGEKVKINVSIFSFIFTAHFVMASLLYASVRARHFCKIANISIYCLLWQGKGIPNIPALLMTLPECMTLPEILPTTIFSVKLMHLCIVHYITSTTYIACPENIGGDFITHYTMWPAWLIT